MVIKWRLENARPKLFGTITKGVSTKIGNKIWTNKDIFPLTTFPDILTGSYHYQFPYVVS